MQVKNQLKIIKSSFKSPRPFTMVFSFGPKIGLRKKKLSFSPKTNSLFFHQIHLWVVKSPLKQFHVIPRSWVFHNGVSNPFKSRTHYFKILFLIEPSISKTNTYLNTISVQFNSQNIALSNIFYHFFQILLCMSSSVIYLFY